MTVVNRVSLAVIATAALCASASQAFVGFCPTNGAQVEVTVGANPTRYAFGNQNIPFVLPFPADLGDIEHDQSIVFSNVAAQPVFLSPSTSITFVQIRARSYRAGDPVPAFTNFNLVNTGQPGFCSSSGGLVWALTGDLFQVNSPASLGPHTVDLEIRVDGNFDPPSTVFTETITFNQLAPPPVSVPVLTLPGALALVVFALLAGAFRVPAADESA